MKIKQNYLFIIVGLTLLFFFISIGTSIAQDSTKVSASTIYNDVKHGININAPKIEKAIGSIAKDLKVTADQVWDILVKQQKVWSYCFLLLTLSALTNWYIWYSNNYKKLTKDNSYSTIETGVRRENNPLWNSESYSARVLNKWKTEEEYKYERLVSNKSISIPWFKYVHLIICIILSIFSYIHFADMLTGFLNPEFGAMKTIAEIAKSIK